MSDRHHDDDDHVREHDRPLSGPALRVKALESLLVEKGLVDPKALDELNKLKDQAAKGELDPEKKKELGDQMAQMEKALQKMADAQQQAKARRWKGSRLDRNAALRKLLFDRAHFIRPGSQSEMAGM